MKRILSILVVATLAAATAFVSEAAGKPGRKELKQQKEVKEILNILNSRSFRIEINTVLHAINGSPLDLNEVAEKPVVLFRPDGIHFSVPYFTGNAPLDGVMSNDQLDYSDVDPFAPHQQTAQIYPKTWLDWVSGYPADYKITTENGSVKMSFSTSMGDSYTYFCNFEFSRRNCDFTIECKSYTKTQYRGHLIDENL